MSRLKVYPGTLGRHPYITVKNKKKSGGEFPMVALLIIFGVVSLFSIMAFFIALLALAK
jgi:hypothetical protein